MTDIWLLPTLWLRNLWSFNQAEGYHNIEKQQQSKDFGAVKLSHPKLVEYGLNFQTPDKWLFTNIETNTEKLFGVPNQSLYVKDLFHEVIIKHNFELTDKVTEGSKFAPMYKLNIEANGSKEIRLRLSKLAYVKNPLLKNLPPLSLKELKRPMIFIVNLVVQMPICKIYKDKHLLECCGRSNIII